jgi:hemoglobin
MNMYQRIGEETIQAVITEFYKRAFVDPIIGHFFHNKDREEITRKQIDFAVSMLGGPKRYRGRPLELAHAEFTIRKPHFDRRQVLFREVLEAYKLERIEIDEWLILEDNLRKLIITVVDACNHQRDAIST